jgi:hypothetical protein
VADGFFQHFVLLIGVNAVAAYTAETYLPDKFRHSFPLPGCNLEPTFKRNIVVWIKPFLLLS